MEMILIIVLAAAVAMLLPNPANQSPQPQYLIVQPAIPSEPAANGPGCLIWVIGGLIVLTLLDVIRW